MPQDPKNKYLKQIRHQNVLEGLKDIGNSTANTIKKDVLKPQDFMEQLLGKAYSPKNFSGEITPGEAIEMKDVFSGREEEEAKIRKQLAHERKLHQEEQMLIEKKSQELRVTLHALIEEIKVLAENTQELTQEVEVAAMQAPVEPGVYHVIFFEKLLEFIKSFRRKIEDASIWLHATNKRASKMNYWGKYKKHGGKFLLSADHYLQRSAG
jgi:hypothetical protein